jgi:hypothetical protein
MANKYWFVRGLGKIGIRQELNSTGSFPSLALTSRRLTQLLPRGRALFPLPRLFPAAATLRAAAEQRDNN